MKDVAIGLWWGVCSFWWVGAGRFVHGRFGVAELLCVAVLLLLAGGGLAPWMRSLVASS